MEDQQVLDARRGASLPEFAELNLKEVSGSHQELKGVLGCHQELTETRKQSHERIIDLIPGPLNISANHPSHSTKEKRTNPSTLQTQNQPAHPTTHPAKPGVGSKKEAVKPTKKEGDKRAKTGTTKERTKSSKVGQSIVMGSEKPQYLQLSLDQIRDLALQQSKGELELSNINTESCCIHSNGDKMENKKNKPTKPRKVLSSGNKENNKTNLNLGNSDPTTTLNAPKLISKVKPSDVSAPRAKSQGGGTETRNGSLESPGLIKDAGTRTNGTTRSNPRARSAPKPEKKREEPKRTTVSPTRKVSPEQGRVASPVRNPRMDIKSASPKPKIAENPVEDEDPRKHSSSSTSSMSSLENARNSKKNSTEKPTVKKISRNPSFTERAPSKPTESNVKGGFLAPTRAWLSHMGEKINYKSRSPSPMNKEGQRSSTTPRQPPDRTPSPRRPRDSSTESETRPKPVSGRVRKPGDKDPGLPSVKRTSSMRVKPTPVVPTVPLKRSASLKKASAPIRDPSTKPIKARSGNKSEKDQNTGGLKKDENTVGSKKKENAGSIKKEPPPVPPKPDKATIERIEACREEGLELSSTKLDLSHTNSNCKYKCLNKL